MNTKFLILLLSLTSLKAQVGIGTSTPEALLHVVAKNPNIPSANDGILIPRVSTFPVNPKSKGQLVFFNGNSNLNKGFYYWDGTDWNSFILDDFSREFDKSIYVVTGEGYSGNGGITERNVLFTNIVAQNLNGFTLSNNQIKVGKSGTYLINFNSALKKDTESYRATYTYKIYKNAQLILSSSNSIPNETITASSVSLSDMIDLNDGDILQVKVQKLDEKHTNNTYIGYGTNTITLTYLKD